jgi:heme exporter protein A
MVRERTCPAVDVHQLGSDCAVGLAAATTHNDRMLLASNLACVRGERVLFSGLACAVGPGEWLHVRGSNGAGKTSLLRVLAGLSLPDAGEVRWCGRVLAEAGAAFRENLGFTGHLAGVKEDLTPRENLALAAALDGAEPPPGDVAQALRRLGLKGREDLPVRLLSAGQKRRVLLARLFLRRARLWVLDEPFTALDAGAVEVLAELLAEHVAGGGMAVLSSHLAVPVNGGRELEL